ncbi:unnamed protein product [Schistosoma mattheei]|uniref:Uncharacterized protein n=1 Tax=Schistosoma mattheei TaxID=31246 RepID=A0A183Q5Z5_9TREM|nr:unnamed protein product [Schistosoma mattheei]
MWSILAVVGTSAFSASAGILSGPAALPLLVFLMAMLISSIVGGPTSIGRSVGAASMLGGFCGAGRFKIRLRVQEVIDLIQDSEKLQQERQKAKASRHIYTGYGNTNDLDWGYSSYKNGGDYGQRS